MSMKIDKEIKELLFDIKRYKQRLSAKLYDPKKKYHSLMEYIFREDNTKGFSYTELERLNHELWDEIAHRKELMDSNKAYWDAIFKFADKKGIKYTKDKFKGETFYAPLVYDSKPVKGITRPPKRWFYAMLKGIARKSDVRNPATVVGNIWKNLTLKKRIEIMKRELKGEKFAYDLPLPDDKRTRGVGTVRMVKPFKLTEVQVNLSVSDYLSALRSGLFSKMKRSDGSVALVSRCKSPKRNVNIFVDKYRNSLII